MKNFEWKNEENNIDPNDPDMNTGDDGPDEPGEEDMAKLFLVWLIEKICMGMAWAQIFLCTYAAFAWLWQTRWAPFATFLVFLVGAFEKAARVAVLTLNPTVQTEKIMYDDDDDNNDSNNLGRRV